MVASETELTPWAWRSRMRGPMANLNKSFGFGTVFDGGQALYAGDEWPKSMGLR